MILALPTEQFLPNKKISPPLTTSVCFLRLQKWLKQSVRGGKSVGGTSGKFGFTGWALNASSAVEGHRSSFFLQSPLFPSRLHLMRSKAPHLSPIRRLWWRMTSIIVAENSPYADFLSGSSEWLIQYCELVIDRWPLTKSISIYGRFPHPAY